MVHLFLMTRGIQASRDMWKKFMETQMFNFPQIPLLKDKDGNFLKNADGSYVRGEKPEAYSRVQGALRPIEFWEYVFPQESLGEVLAMMNLQNAFPLRPEVNNYAWILRKLLRAKKIPQLFLDTIKDKQSWEITSKFVPMNGMAVYPVGIKEDETHDYIFGDVGYYQEGL